MKLNKDIKMLKELLNNYENNYIVWNDKHNSFELYFYNGDDYETSDNESIYINTNDDELVKEEIKGYDNNKKFDNLFVDYDNEFFEDEAIVISCVETDLDPEIGIIGILLKDIKIKEFK